jgi:hypothetical protein
MHSSLARSASIAVTCILTGALLVGCSGTRSVPGVAWAASQPQLGQLVLPPTLAQPDLAIGNETMTADRFSGNCSSFNVSGSAQGPYPGKFQASGSWTSGYSQRDGPPRLKSFSESFTITSHAKTITGSFIWGGGYILATCTYIGQSTDFTYTATLMRGGKVRKQFAGSASESSIDLAPGFLRFGETLI